MVPRPRTCGKMRSPSAATRSCSASRRSSSPSPASWVTVIPLVRAIEYSHSRSKRPTNWNTPPPASLMPLAIASSSG